MPKARIIRRSYVEYQPSLKQPIDPIPLGVVAEELSGREGHVVVLGREPKEGSLAALNLDNLWGPFRSSLTTWIEILDRNLDRVISERQPGGFTVDRLAQEWSKNIYLTEPVSVKIGSKDIPLMQLASRWYRRYVGEPFQTQTKRRRPARRATAKPQHTVSYWRKRSSDIPESAHP
jgi:hypothetical protein